MTSSSYPLTILTLVIGPDYRRSLATCLESKVAYAKKHGYMYIQGDESDWNRSRPISWSKVPFLLKHLDRLPEGALVWLSDADVLITNPDLPFEKHVLPLMRDDKDLLMTFDSCGHINAGNLVYRNTAWTRDFLKRVWAKDDEVYHIWWENAAIINLLQTNIDDAKKIQVTKEHKRFNAYLRGLEGEPLWTPGDLLVHFAGVYEPTEIANLVNAIKRGEVPRIAM